MSDDHWGVPFTTVIAVVELWGPPDRALPVVAELARTGAIPSRS